MTETEKTPKLIKKKEEPSRDSYFFYSCPQCTLIPEIIIIDRKNGIIKIKCSTHGEQEIKICDSIKSLTKNNSSNAKCELCSKNTSKKFCIHCNKIICKECLKNHENKEKLINTSDMYNKCYLHFENFLFYCFTCNKSICLSCISSKEHQFHKKELLNELEPSKEKIKYFEDLNGKYLEEKNILLKKVKELDNLIKYYLLKEKKNIKK